MHAVVVRVSIQDAGPAEEFLKSEIVPRVSQAPGFVAGYWSRSEDGSNGLSMIVMESEEGARGMAQQIDVGDEAPVRLDEVEVREVVASA
jgi:hypothetical protein